MENVAVYIRVLFIFSTFLTVLFFYLAARESRKVLYLVGAWMLFQSVLGMAGFYTNFHKFPSRFLLLVGPPMLVILILFITARGKVFLDKLDLRLLTLLHSIRFPVEIVLYFLFVAGTVPEHMTFNGINFDILAGLSALPVYYFGFIKNKLNRFTLIVWNVLCLLLLANVVILALLSAPTPFQQVGFDQPNRAVAYFPFLWLPGVVVPLVLLSQLAALRQLRAVPAAQTDLKS